MGTVWCQPCASTPRMWFLLSFPITASPTWEDSLVSTLFLVPLIRCHLSPPQLQLLAHEAEFCTELEARPTLGPPDSHADPQHGPSLPTPPQPQRSPTTGSPSSHSLCPLTDSHMFAVSHTHMSPASVDFHKGEDGLWSALYARHKIHFLWHRASTSVREMSEGLCSLLLTSRNLHLSGTRVSILWVPASGAASCAPHPARLAPLGTCSSTHFL